MWAKLSRLRKENQFDPEEKEQHIKKCSSYPRHLCQRTCQRHNWLASAMTSSHRPPCSPHPGAATGPPLRPQCKCPSPRPAGRRTGPVRTSWSGWTSSPSFYSRSEIVRKHPAQRHPCPGHRQSTVPDCARESYYWRIGERKHYNQIKSINQSIDQTEEINQSTHQSNQSIKRINRRQSITTKNWGSKKMRQKKTYTTMINSTIICRYSGWAMRSSRASTFSAKLSS